MDSLLGNCPWPQLIPSWVGQIPKNYHEKWLICPSNPYVSLSITINHHQATSIFDIYGLMVKLIMIDGEAYMAYMFIIDIVLMVYYSAYIWYGWLSWVIWWNHCHPLWWHLGSAGHRHVHHPGHVQVWAPGWLTATKNIVDWRMVWVL